MYKCAYRGTYYDKPYCKRDGGYCTTLHWMWCKGIIIFLFMALAIAYFVYGVVYAWQNTEDRIDLRKRVEANRIEAETRIDELELQLKAYNKTIIKHWIWERKKREGHG